jgi:hypothetical protein
MKTEIRKILADKTETLEDGRVVIVPDFSQLDDLVDDLNTLFSLHVVSQRSELLLAYEQSKCTKTWWMNKNQAENEVNDFIANNCA